MSGEKMITDGTVKMVAFVLGSVIFVSILWGWLIPVYVRWIIQ